MGLRFLLVDNGSSKSIIESHLLFIFFIAIFALNIGSIILFFLRKLIEEYEYYTDVTADLILCTLISYSLITDAFVVSVDESKIFLGVFQSP